MKALAGWVLAGRLNAVSVACGFALPGMLLPPLLVLSMAVPALVGLRQGARAGLMVVLGGGFVMTALAIAFAHLGFMAQALVIVALWLLVWAVSQVYRSYASAGMMAVAAGGIGFLLIGLIYVAAYLWKGMEPRIIWFVLLEVFAQPVLEQTGLTQSEAEMESLLTTMAVLMTGGVVNAVCLLIILSLLLARWWQAMLFNPGGFRAEFHGLKLGRFAAWLMVGLLAATLVWRSGITLDLLFVAWLLFFFQGLAVAHSLTAQTGTHPFWLVILYVLMALLPYTIPVLSALGFAESWFNTRELIRKRMAGGPGGKD